MLGFIVPTGQGVQATVVAPAAEYDPVWQLPVTAINPEPEQYRPGLQDVHAACPTAGWNEPGAHAVHVTAVAAAAEYEPAWHNPVAAVSADVAQYMPGEHE
jgi:hypothetical protein